MTETVPAPTAIITSPAKAAKKAKPAASSTAKSLTMRSFLSFFREDFQALGGRILKSLKIFLTVDSETLISLYIFKNSVTIAKLALKIGEEGSLYKSKIKEPLYVIYANRKLQSPRIKCFIEFLQQKLKLHPWKIDF